VLILGVGNDLGIP